MIIILFTLPSLMIYFASVSKVKGFTIEEQAKILNIYYKSLAYYDINLLQAFKYSYWKAIYNISQYDLGCGVENNISIWRDDRKNCNVTKTLGYILFFIINNTNFTKYFDFYLKKIREKAKEEELYKLEIKGWNDTNFIKIFKKYKKNEAYKIATFLYPLSYEDRNFEHYFTENLTFIFDDYSFLLLFNYDSSELDIEKINKTCFERKGRETIFDKSCYKKEYSDFRRIATIYCKGNKMYLRTLYTFLENLPYLGKWNVSFLKYTYISECGGYYTVNTDHTIKIYKLLCQGANVGWIYSLKEKENIITLCKVEDRCISVKIGEKLIYDIKRTNGNLDKQGCVGVLYKICNCTKGSPKFIPPDDCTCEYKCLSCK